MSKSNDDPRVWVASRLRRAGALRDHVASYWVTGLQAPMNEYLETAAQVAEGRVGAGHLIGAAVDVWMQAARLTRGSYQALYQAYVTPPPVFGEVVLTIDDQAEAMDPVPLFGIDSGDVADLCASALAHTDRNCEVPADCVSLTTMNGHAFLSLRDLGRLTLELGTYKGRIFRVSTAETVARIALQRVSHRAPR